MSSLTDRRQSILGRRRTADPATKPKRVRAPRLTKPAVTVDPGDPQAWKEFKPNTLAYARLWLETGELPAETHFVIRERLAPWIAAVQVGGEDLRAALLVVVPKIEPRVPVPARDWIMSAIGKALLAEPLPADVEQATSGREAARTETDPANTVSVRTQEIHSENPQKSSFFQGSDGVNPPLPANDTGDAVSGGIEQAEPSNSAKSAFSPDDAVKDAPTSYAEHPRHWEVLSDPVEIRKRRRGYPSAFEAEFWGETPKLPAYPSYPVGKVSGITLAKYRAKLLPAIGDRSVPALLPAKVALAALKIDKEIPATFDPRRRPAWWPKWLPIARQDGEWLVERDELREHLFPELYLGQRHACPIAVARCRHCGRLSNHGWADQICDRCEAVRTKIEAAQMARFSVTERRGWKGPPLSTDDELLLAIQRRLANTDRTEVAKVEKEERRAAREKRRHEGNAELGANPEPQEEGFAEAA
jgi:hypothetical protein